MRKKPVLLAALALALRATLALAEVPTPAGPPSPTAPPSSELETWLSTQHDAAGRSCDRRAIETAGEQHVIACGDAGLWTVRRDATRGFVLVRTDDLGGPVTGLFVRGGKVWAEIVRSEARPVALGGSEPGSARAFPLERSETLPPAPPRPPSAARAPVAPTAPRPNAREGRVTETLLGEVVINLGRADGIRYGEHIELSSVVTEDLGTEEAVRRSIEAIGVVTAVSRGYSRVKLGIGERVPVGALARRTEDDATAARAGTPRLGGLWEVGFMVRPFLALSEFGGGALIEASAGYRFLGPLHLVAAFEPLAHATGNDKPTVTPVSAFFKASYDLALFEVGFGVGMETVFDTPFGTEPGTGTLFVQQARIGAADGLHVDAINHVVLFHSEFEFSGFVGRLQIPVGQASWILMRGGGGSAGYAYGELGVRVLLNGNGDRGSTYFSGTFGGAGVFKKQTQSCGSIDFVFDCSQTVSYAGPMVGAGAEFRF
jgi:hypothetical protein